MTNEGEGDNNRSLAALIVAWTKSFNQPLINFTGKIRDSKKFVCLLTVIIFIYKFEMG